MLTRRRFSQAMSRGLLVLAASPLLADAEEIRRRYWQLDRTHLGIVPQVPCLPPPHVARIFGYSVAFDSGHGVPDDPVMVNLVRHDIIGGSVVLHQFAMSPFEASYVTFDFPVLTAGGEMFTIELDAPMRSDVETGIGAEIDGIVTHVERWFPGVMSENFEVAERRHILHEIDWASARPVYC